MNDKCGDGKIAESILRIMKFAKSDDRISVIIEIPRDNLDERLAVKKRLIGMGAVLNLIDGRYFFCSLYVFEIWNVSTWPEVARISADCRRIRMIREF